MTHDEAIESLLETCQNLYEAIELLQVENAFLADTIEKNNLGELKYERRSLLSENEQYKEAADIAIQNAKQVKLEYETKMHEAESRLADAKKKQMEVDSYIEVETENRLTNMRMEYNKLLQEKETFLKEKLKKYMVVTLTSVAVAVIGIIINFL